MSFDIAGARKAGYSDDEIQGFLEQENPNFDFKGARSSGYSLDEISSELKPAASEAPKSNGLLRTAGLKLRSYGPNASAAGLGALGASATLGPEMAPVGAGAGLLAKGIYDVGSWGYNKLRPNSWPEALSTDEAIGGLMDRVGIPRPETSSERIYDAVDRGISDSLALTGGGPVKGVASLFEQAKNPVVAGVAKTLTEAPATQAMLSGIGGAGVGVAREAAPDSPGAQLAASIAAPLTAVAAHKVVTAPINFIGKDVAAGLVTGKNSLGESVGRRQAAAERYAENQVADRLQTLVGTPEQKAAAVENLTRGADLNVNGYSPTSGTLSADPNLIAIERSMSGRADLKGTGGDSVLSRYNDNRQAITQGLNNVVENQVGASPAAPQGFFSRLLGNQTRAAQNSVAAGEAGVARAEQVLGQNQAGVNALGSDVVRNEASKSVRDTLGKNFDEYRQQANELYSAVPEDVKVDISGSIAKARALAKEYSGTVGSVPPQIEAFQSLGKSAQPNNPTLQGILQSMGEGGTQMSAIKAQRNLEELYSAIQEAPKNSPQAKALADLRASLDADISKSEAVSEPLRAARDFYRAELAPRFKQGASDRVLNRRGPGGADAVAPENTIAPYMGTESEAARLKTALTGTASELPAPDAKSIRDWTLSKMASEIGENPNGTKIRAWVKQNESVLNQFPEVKQEAQRMANRIGGSARFKDKMAADLAERQAGLKAAQEEATSSNPAKFAQGGPEGAVANIDSFIYGNRAGGQMAELVKQAKKDKTGASLEGLRNAVKESVSRKVRAGGGSSDLTNFADAAKQEDFPTTLAKMNKVFAEGPTRDALKQIFTPEEMGSLDQVRKQIEVSNRINTKAAAGSDTHANTSNDDVAAAFRRGAWSLDVVKYGKTIGSALDIGGTVLRSAFMKDPKRVTQQLYVDAMLKPEIARTLLMKDGPQKIKAIKQSIVPYLNGILQPGEAEQPQPSRRERLLNGVE